MESVDVDVPANTKACPFYMLTEDAAKLVLCFVYSTENIKSVMDRRCVSKYFNTIISSEDFLILCTVIAWKTDCTRQEKRFPVEMNIDYPYMIKQLEKRDCWHLAACDIPKINSILAISKDDRQPSMKGSKNSKKLSPAEDTSYCSRKDCPTNLIETKSKSTKRHKEASVVVPLWYCAIRGCNNRGCVRTTPQQCAIKHYREKNHYVSAMGPTYNKRSTQVGQVWCYSCSKYLGTHVKEYCS